MTPRPRLPPSALPSFLSTCSSTIVDGPDKTTSLLESPFLADDEEWLLEGLVVLVIGASGDLAKKKTYPSLLNLFASDLLPADTVIWGYARSKKTHESLRSDLKPFLLKLTDCDEAVIDSFLSHCYYKSGRSYGDEDAYSALAREFDEYECSHPDKPAHNRLFYFAIPPNVFGETGTAIKNVAMADKGWSRIIIEKPFGHDLPSCLELSGLLSSHFDEHHLYRIDHYLGKEMAQNLLTLRFGNSWLEWMWHRRAIESVTVCFKEPFGVEGRGGYFDQYGIIRDIIQNHLLQVLTLLAMEAPTQIEGHNAGEHIRDAKVEVLDNMPPITVSNCLLGQYEGYTDDPSITNKASTTPTFAAVKCFINTPRWYGVPFVLKAGKALDDRKVDITIKFKDAPGSFAMFGSKLPPNEMVMRLQPKECIYMKTNIKTPGLASQPVQTELRMDYCNEFDMENNHPDAYTRLILDVLRERNGSFVRDDELVKSWEIFTPLLNQIEEQGVKPFIYRRGTEGPKELEAFLAQKKNNVDDDGVIAMSAL